MTAKKTKTKVSKKKSTAKKSIAKKNTKPAKLQRPARCKSNGYREGSNYGLAFDLLFKLGHKKPVKRSLLLEKYAALAGKDLKRAGYDLAVVLSVHDGNFHRSADSASKKFPHDVKRSGDGLVQLCIK